MRPISSKPDRDTNVVKEAIARQLKLCRINDDLRINYPNREEVRTFLYEHLASCTAFEVRTVTDHILLLQSMPNRHAHGRLRRRACGQYAPQF